MAKKKKFSLTKKQKKYLAKGGKGLAIGGLAAAALFGGAPVVALATPAAAALAGATQAGNKKKKLKVAKKFLIGGLAATAATAGISAATGQGLGAPLVRSAGSIFSGGAESKEEELLAGGLGQRAGDGQEPGLGRAPVDPEDPGIAEDLGDVPEVDVDGKPVPQKSNAALLGAAAFAGYLLLKKKSA